MRLVVCLLVLCVLNVVDMKPVKPATDDLSTEEDEDMDTGLEYDKYLRQVISVLEKDPEMRKKMESSNLQDLKSGKLALELDQMPGHYRSQLDELKRIEVQRLRLAAKQMMEQQAGKVGFIDKLYQGVPGSNPKEKFENLVGHVDPQSPEKFNEKDLTNLLRKATKDLDAADKKRREEFKNYEMEKEIQRREKLKGMDDPHREAAEKEFEEHKKKAKEHDKLKHPASKAQLEEVWEETDHLDKEDFNPKTFFALHDTNGDGNLDPFELEALFIKEVEKIYQESDADPKEKFEELARMREHVLREIDTDKNKLVSKEEFLRATDENEFENDEGWDDLQQDDMFEEEELEGYEKTLRERELKRQRQREEFEARKEKMQKEQENFQKNNVAQEPIAMDQAAAEKKLTDIQQGNDKLEFVPSANDVNENKQAQEPIVNHEAVKIQQEAKMNAGQPIENNVNEVPKQNNEAPKDNNIPPQDNQVPQQGNVINKANIAQPVQPKQENTVNAGQPPVNGQPQAGQPQAGQPPVTGQPQAGQPQAGQPQAGQPQAGQPQAGQPQAGQPQAGQPQAGQPQAGQPQAGQPQAGQPQAGQPQAGQPQAGQPQAGQPQAGQPQAGQPASK